MKKKHSDAFENNSIKVPFVVPNIENSDKNAIEIALKSNLLTDGPILRKFEKEHGERFKPSQGWSILVRSASNNQEEPLNPSINDRCEA